MWPNITSDHLKNLIGQQRYKFIILICLLIFAAFIDLFGIYIIIPVSYVLIGKDQKLLDMDFLSNVNIDSTNVIIIFFSIYLLKFIFLIFTNWYQYKVIYGLQNKLSTESLRFKFENSWRLWNKEHNSRILQIILNETSIVCLQFIMQTITLFSELFFIFILILFLIYYYTTAALLVVFFTSLVIFLYYKIVIKTLVFNVGKKRTEFDTFRIKILNDIILSFKEIKIYLKEKLFVGKYEEINSKYVRTLAILGIMSQFPRLVIEIIVIFLATIFFIYIQKNPIEFQDFIPVLALITSIFLRLMPSFNRIIISIQSIQFAKPALMNLNNFFMKHDKKKNNQDKQIAINLSNSIELKNICFDYDKKNIFKNLNLNMSLGKVYGFKGKSGSGKSTLINIILGLLKPTNGKLIVDGHDMDGNLINWLKNLAFISQDTILLNDTILKNIIFDYSNDKIEDKLLNEAIEKAQLKDFIDKQHEGINTLIGDRGSLISSGQAQRIAIARALYADRKVIIFDEATNALDYETEKKIYNTLNSIKENRLIIIVSHKDDNFELCDEVYEINDLNLIIK